MILCVYFWGFGTPQYHPPEADKSAGATPVKWALLSFLKMHPVKKINKFYPFNKKCR